MFFYDSIISIKRVDLVSIPYFAYAEEHRVVGIKSTVDWVSYEKKNQCLYEKHRFLFQRSHNISMY